MKKIKLIAMVALLAIVGSCATKNTGGKKLSKKEQLEQLSAEVKGLQQQLVKEGNAAKAYMTNLQKKLIKTNMTVDSLYNTPLLANAMAEGRLDLGAAFKEITIHMFSYEITPKLLVFPTDLMETKVSYSKSDKINYLSQLKGSLQESLTADRAKTKATVQEFEKELANREKLIETLKNYKQVKIGKQIWLAENLNVDKFRNGDPIPHAITAEEWKKASKNKQPAWCYFDNDPLNGEKYGKLYNWYAVNDPRGLAPVGYHVSSDAEWTALTNYLGEGVKKSGAKSGLALNAGTKMKSTSGWNENGIRLVGLIINAHTPNGTNSSGFSSLPGGRRDIYGTFNYVGGTGCWWSSTEDDAGSAWYRLMNYSSCDVFWDDHSKGDGYSVRCLRD